MAQHLVAIIGSLDPNRSYMPSLQNAQHAQGAAEEFGKALAKAGYGIVVYSAGQGFLELPVVRGYVRSGVAQPNSIRVCFPLKRDPEIHGDFPEQAEHGELFDFRPDTQEDWEHSYYLSLGEVTGMLLMGGGQATLVSGLMALASRTPLLALGTFGGSAQKIWLFANGQRWITRADHVAMGSPVWTPGTAESLVASLKQQRTLIENEERAANEREKEWSRLKKSRAVAGVLSLLAAVLLAAIGFVGPKSVALYALGFFGVPIAAGFAGAQVKVLIETVRDPAVRFLQSIWLDALFGMGAGVVASLAFAAAHLMTHRDIGVLAEAVTAGKGGLDVLLLFLLAIGFAAGYTSEAIFGRLQKVDVLRTDVFQGPKG